MQTNKQCKFHAGTDCEYSELEPCLRQTNINWYPALNKRTYIKNSTQIQLISRSTVPQNIDHSLPASCYKRAGTHAKPWLPT
jgi:hypothetical protein